MVSFNNPKIEKIFFSIGETAEMIGVSQSSIRYWEKTFNELTPRKSSGGTRLFSQNDIELLKLIHHLVKERGLTIKGARKKLKDNREETINTWELVKHLQHVKEELIAIYEEMDIPNATDK
jgi:DNA-binding transcriptional MerR regulator